MSLDSKPVEIPQEERSAAFRTAARLSEARSPSSVPRRNASGNGQPLFFGPLVRESLTALQACLRNQAAWDSLARSSGLSRDTSLADLGMDEALSLRAVLFVMQMTLAALVITTLGGLLALVATRPFLSNVGAHYASGHFAFVLGTAGAFAMVTACTLSLRAGLRAGILSSIAGTLLLALGLVAPPIRTALVGAETEKYLAYGIGGFTLALALLVLDRTLDSPKPASISRGNPVSTRAAISEIGYGVTAVIVLALAILVAARSIPDEHDPQPIVLSLLILPAWASLARLQVRRRPGVGWKPFSLSSAPLVVGSGAVLTAYLFLAQFLSTERSASLGGLGAGLITGGAAASLLIFARTFVLPILALVSLPRHFPRRGTGLPGTFLLLGIFALFVRWGAFPDLWSDAVTFVFAGSALAALPVVLAVFARRTMSALRQRN